MFCKIVIVATTQYLYYLFSKDSSDSHITPESFDARIRKGEPVNFAILQLSEGKTVKHTDELGKLI